MAERREGEDLLFAYAAGELAGEARRQLEARFAAEPQLRERLAWYEAVCDAFIETLPPARRLPAADDVLARIRAAAPQPDSAGALARFIDWIAGPALRPVAAIAIALVVVQGAVIGVLLQREEPPLTRSPATVGNAVVFVVAFNPETPESKVRALLLEAGATIVDGPQQLGEYRVLVPANRAQFARDVFTGSAVVEYLRQEPPGALKKW